MKRARLLLSAVALSGITLAAAPAAAQQLCAADLNGNGDAADPGETARCHLTAAGGWMCPIGETACVTSPAGAPECPLGLSYGCAVPAAGGVPTCSPNSCIDTTTHPIEEVPPPDDPGALPDGPVDAEGNCLGNIEIFSGRAARCRPAGLLTTFANCCADKGKIVKDGMGGKLTSLSTKIAVAKGVFSGMSAAFAAFRGGATAGEAAHAGLGGIIGIDPTSIAVSIAINFMIEVLLQGCDSQDMEVGMLSGSGMCHFVGSYCTTSVLGICLQKAHGNCCFNTKLGRIIQEQGRPQLKSFATIGWGDAKHPYCRGFSSDEFQALDFSKMDLSEYYADIESRAQSQIQVDMQSKLDVYKSALHE